MNTQNQKTMPMTIVRSGLKRPSWICRNVKQNVILLRDKSGSMEGQKAKDASAASIDLVGELAEASNKDGFNVAIVDFASKSEIIHSIEKATLLNANVSPLTVGFLSGSTNVTAGLEDAVSILEKAENQDQEGVVYLRPVVIVFTDGCHNEGPAPHKTADRLKSIADLVTVAFGSDADESLMRSLATTPQHFYRCSSGRELRSFLAAVGATMTATMASGSNATEALMTIQQ